MAAATSPRVPELEFLWFAQGKNMRHLAESRNPSPGGGVSCRLRHGGTGTAAGQPDSRAALWMQNPPDFGRFNVLCVLVITWSLTTAPMWKALAITDIAVGRDRLAKGVGRWR